MFPFASGSYRFDPLGHDPLGQVCGRGLRKQSVIELFGVWHRPPQAEF